MNDHVVATYDRRAAEYAEHFGAMAATHPQDRALVARWAAARSGRLLDAGCGPGQWTAWLADQGYDVEGVDGSSSFVAHARATWAGVPFRVARLDALGIPDQSLDGVLAWYSLIHLPPAQVPGVLDELARCVAPGGGLLVGLFDGEDLVPFDHKVVRAYTWSADDATRRLDVAGFDVVDVERRSVPGVRPHLAVLARRRAGERSPAQGPSNAAGTTAIPSGRR